jgi:hypothetical protein
MTGLSGDTPRTVLLSRDRKGVITKRREYRDTVTASLAVPLPYGHGSASRIRGEFPNGAVGRTLLGILACGLLCGQAPPEKLQVSKTETSDFPAGGALQLKNAVGELTITGWDEPNFEITTIKSTKIVVEAKDRAAANKLLENVKIATERKGDAVIISTDFPKHSKMARPFLGMTDFDLEYRIHVPRKARLDVDEVMGEVHIESIAGDIRAIEHLGQITVRVPEGMYAIDARSKLGAVNSDFPGSGRQLKWWVVKWPGQAFMTTAPPASQKMFLRAGYGDIVILKVH